MVEGLFDCLRLKQQKIYNCVALLGSNLSIYQFCLLTRFTNNIFLILDGDVAGQQAAEKIKVTYSKFNQINIKKITLPQNKDPDEYFLHNDFLQYINERLFLFTN